MHVRSGRALRAAALAVVLALPSAPATPAEDAAHRLAETFAGAHAGDATETRASAREETARKAAEAARRAVEAALAARQRRTDEADMLARARAEAAEREAAERQAREEAVTEPLAPVAARAEEAGISEDAPSPGDIAGHPPAAEETKGNLRDDATRRLAEAQRTEETRQLAERLRQVRDAEAERIVREAEADAEARRAEGYDQTFTKPAGPATVASRHATVLLVLEPGSRGIRRWNKTADPMLCIGETCYISTGATAAATALTRAKAFGPGVALGSRAGACRNALGCVFRAIKLDHAATSMQPIDLRILRHDRREIREVTADETCRLTRGVLSCRTPVRADTYRAWIVPEDLAELTGPEALAAALGAGLPDEVSGRD